MDIVKAIGLRIVRAFLEANVTADTVDEELAKLKAALDAYVAKTPSKVDDKIVDAVERVLVSGDTLKVIEAELVKVAESLAAGTATEMDDMVVAVFKKALGV